MMNMGAPLVAGLLSILLLGACDKSPESAPPSPATAGATATPAAQAELPALPKNSAGFVDITGEQLAAAMKGKNFALVNVHVPDEGDLPGTDLSIPYDQITAHLDKLPGKEAPIVLYCRSGSMSTQAAVALAAAGYTRIYELDGGFNEWKAAGRDFVGK